MVRIADSTVLFEGCWFACGPNPVFDRDLRSAPQNNLQNSKRNCWHDKRIPSQLLIRVRVVATLFILYKMENYKQQKLFSLGVQCAVYIHACSSVKCNKSKTRHFHREHADKLKSWHSVSSNRKKNKRLAAKNSAHISCGNGFYKM